MSLKIIPADEIIPEIEVSPPLTRNGETYPWLLCWGFLPNTDIEVRELAETWQEKSQGKESIRSQYEHRMLKRTLTFLIRMNVLKHYDSRTTLRDNWLAQTGVKEPILKYLSSRIPKENKLLFSIIYTECFWKQFAPMAKA